MRPAPPAETLLKTEKTVLVLEGIGAGKISLHRKVLGDAKVILEGQVLEVRAIGKQLHIPRKARVAEPVGQSPARPDVTAQRASRYRTRLMVGLRAPYRTPLSGLSAHKRGTPAWEP